MGVVRIFCNNPISLSQMMDNPLKMETKVMDWARMPGVRKAK